MALQEWKGQRGGPRARGAAAAADQAAWEDAWRRVGQEAPPLDFARFVGIMVYAGERPTGGYAVAFDPPAERGRDLVVRYRVLKPSGFATQALAQPWAARAYPRPRGRVFLEAGE